MFQTFIDGLAEGSDEPAFSKAMAHAATALDLTCFAYLCLPHRQADEARVISTYPPLWTAHYLKNHYERLDPVIRRALQVTEPFEWGNSIASRELSDAQRQLFEEAARFGIRYGFTIPIHDGRGPVAGVTFASDEQGSTFRRCVDANRRVLQLMALYFHASARRKLRSDRVVDGAALSRASTSASNGRQRGNPLYLAVLIGRTKSTLNYAISRLFAHRHFLSLCLSALIAV